MIAVKRGCGERVAGGVYLCTPLGPGGHPLECYILDPPRPAEADVLGLSPVGITLFKSSPTTHVMDWIGSEHYPNVADFLEETRRLGVSRRVPANTDFSLLTPSSRLFCAHARAIIENAAELEVAFPLYADLDLPPCAACAAYRHCERGSLAGHSPCSALWWHDVEGGVDAGGGGMVRRTIGDTTYAGWNHRATVTPRHHLGLFAALPIAQIEVVEDREGGTTDEKVARASRSALPVEVVDA